MGNIRGSRYDLASDVPVLRGSQYAPRPTAPQRTTPESQRVPTERRDVVQVKGGYISQDEYNKLSPEDQQRIRTIGVDQFNTENSASVAKFKSENVEVKGSYIPLIDFNKLSPEDQARLKAIGVEAFNAENEAAVAKFKADNVEVQGGWMAKADYDALSPTDQQRVRTLGVLAFNAENEAAVTKFKAENTEIAGGYISNEEFAKLSPDDQNRLKTSGVEKFNAENAAADAQFKATHTEVKDGWMANTDFNSLNATDQTRIKAIGVSAFNAENAQILDSLKDYYIEPTTTKVLQKWYLDPDVAGPTNIEVVSKTTPGGYNVVQAAADGRVTTAQLVNVGFLPNTSEAKQTFEAEVAKTQRINAALETISDPKYMTLVNGEPSYNLQAIYHDKPISSGDIISIFGAQPGDSPKVVAEKKAALISAIKGNEAHAKAELAKEYRPVSTKAAAISRSYLSYTVPGYSTQRNWRYMTTSQKAFSVGLDVVAGLLFAAPVIEGGARGVSAIARLAGQNTIRRSALEISSAAYAIQAAPKSALVLKGVLTTGGVLTATNTAVNWNGMNNYQRALSIGLSALMLAPATSSAIRFTKNSAVGEFKVAASRLQKVTKKLTSAELRNIRETYGEPTADAYSRMMKTRAKVTEARINRATISQGKGWLAKVGTPTRAASRVARLAETRASRVSRLSEEIDVLETQLRKDATNFVQKIAKANADVGTHESDLANINRYLGIDKQYANRFANDLLKNTRSAVEAITGTENTLEFYQSRYEKAMSDLLKAKEKFNDPSKYPDLIQDALTTEIEYELAKAGNIERMHLELQHIRESLKHPGSLSRSQLFALGKRAKSLEGNIGRALKSFEITDQYKYTYDTFGGENVGIKKIEVVASDGTYEYQLTGYDKAGNPEFSFRKTSSVGLHRGSGGKGVTIEEPPTTWDGGTSLAHDLDTGRMTFDQIAKLRGGLPLVSAVSRSYAKPRISTISPNRVTPEISSPIVSPEIMTPDEIRRILGPDISHSTIQEVQSMIDNAIKSVPSNETINRINSQIKESISNQIKSEVSPQTKAQTQTKVQPLTKAAVQIAIALRLERPLEIPRPQKPIPIILPPTSKEQEEKRKRYPAGSVGWRQGALRKSVYWVMFKEHKKIVTKYHGQTPPVGVKIVSGIRSAYESFGKTPGYVPREMRGKLGIMDIRSLGHGKEIRYKRVLSRGRKGKPTTSKTR